MHSSPPPPLVHETSALLELQKPSQSLCTRRVPCWEGTDLLELQSLVHETSALLGGDGLAGAAKAFTKLVHETSALLEGTDLLESESSRTTGLLLPQKMVDAPDEEEIAMRMCVLW